MACQRFQGEFQDLRHSSKSHFEIPPNVLFRRFCLENIFKYVLEYQEKIKKVEIQRNKEAALQALVEPERHSLVRGDLL